MNDYCRLFELWKGPAATARELGALQTRNKIIQKLLLVMRQIACLMDSVQLATEQGERMAAFPDRRRTRELRPACLNCLLPFALGAALGPRVNSHGLTLQVGEQRGGLVIRLRGSEELGRADTPTSPPGGHAERPARTPGRLGAAGNRTQRGQRDGSTLWPLISPC